MAEVRSHFDGVGFAAYQVIVVDDGSEDETSEMVKHLAHSWPELHLIRHSENKGKGAAVRTGILAATYPLLLFADADGATPITYERSLREAIEKGADVAIGSRISKDESVSISRSLPRWFFGRCFASASRFIVRVPINDPQCGFKMFRREVGHHLFSLCEENGYLFDINILALAVRLGYSIAEEPVSWQDKAGSKVHIVSDGFSMMRGLLRVRHTVDQITQLTDSEGVQVLA